LINCEPCVFITLTAWVVVVVVRLLVECCQFVSVGSVERDNRKVGPAG
jgi:hypothetical protein